MELSVEQQMAVETMDKKVLVVSAAGVGKTRTLTEHAKYLLRDVINSSELILITYTNNAAQERRER